MLHLTAFAIMSADLTQPHLILCSMVFVNACSDVFML